MTRTLLSVRLLRGFVAGIRGARALKRRQASHHTPPFPFRPSPSLSPPFAGTRASRVPCNGGQSLRRNGGGVGTHPAEVCGSASLCSVKERPLPWHESGPKDSHSDEETDLPHPPPPQNSSPPFPLPIPLLFLLLYCHFVALAGLSVIGTPSPASVVITLIRYSCFWRTFKALVACYDWRCHS